MNLHDPRKQAIDALQQSTPSEIWSTNSSNVEQLRSKIKQHPLARNAIIKLLNEGDLDFDAIKKIHLEYRYAIVQIFTDALLMAQFQTRQLEPRLHPGSKIIPRFLLTLNTLDEFGFTPGHDCNGYYKGNPSQAHYPLFENVLDSLGVSIQERQAYIPSPISQSVRSFLEDSYYDYVTTVALLAVAEEQVVLFSPPLRQATKAIGLNVSQGYYHVHGTTTDDDTEAADDDHQNDLWYAVIQACPPDKFWQLEKACLDYCNLWNEFWCVQLRQASKDLLVCS